MKSLALLLLLLFYFFVEFQAHRFKFVNKCRHPVELFDNDEIRIIPPPDCHHYDRPHHHYRRPHHHYRRPHHHYRRPRDHYHHHKNTSSVINLNQNVLTIPYADKHILMYRHGQNPQATLAEFCVEKNTGRVWYDISVVPPGCSRSSKSLEACHREAGTSGFNLPLSIIPETRYHDTCQGLVCLHPNCSSAYNFPDDDLATHVCPYGTAFKVIFCPYKRYKKPNSKKPNHKKTNHKKTNHKKTNHKKTNHKK